MKAVLIACALAMAFFFGISFGADMKMWERYKDTFITKDGRVVDYYQGGVSHSEGQGYGMLLSVVYNDKATFDLLWRWAKDNLQVRKDALLAWCWGRRPNGAWSVVDYNDASDGDMLVALSLLKASERWGDDRYRDEALRIIKSLREELAFTWEGHTLILPGFYGFSMPDGFLLNPSYFIFSAFKRFAEVDDAEFWRKVYADSLSVLSRARFSSLQMPADWILLERGGRISIYSKRSRHFGYEAVRVLLYMCWDGGLDFPPGVDWIFGFYRGFGYIPLYVDLVNNEVSLEDAPAGFYAVYACVADRMGKRKLSRELFERARKKLSAEKKNYYSFSLYLLAGAEDIQ